MPGGRKSLKEEIQITRRYADLTEPAFKLISKKLASDSPIEQNFALDWLKAGFAKMIPTQVGGIGGAPIQIAVLTIEQQQKLEKLILNPNAEGSLLSESGAVSGNGETSASLS